MSTAPKGRTKKLIKQKTGSALVLKKVGDFTNNAPTEGQNTNYKNESSCNGAPRSNIG